MLLFPQLTGVVVITVLNFTGRGGRPALAGRVVPVVIVRAGASGIGGVAVPVVVMVIMVMVMVAVIVTAAVIIPGP